MSHKRKESWRSGAVQRALDSLRALDLPAVEKEFRRGSENPADSGDVAIERLRTLVSIARAAKVRTLQECAREHGISRSTFFRWLMSFAKSGVTGLRTEYQNCGRRRGGMVDIDLDVWMAATRGFILSALEDIYSESGKVSLRAREAAEKKCLRALYLDKKTVVWAISQAAQSENPHLGLLLFRPDCPETLTKALASRQSEQVALLITRAAAMLRTSKLLP